MEWAFYSRNLRFEKPPRSCQEIFRLSGNYSTRIFIPISFYNHQIYIVYFEWIILGNFPLMIRYGYFLVKGSARTCVSQIIRGTGIYMSIKNVRDQSNVFIIDLVPERGFWIRLEKNNSTCVRIRNEPPLMIWSILKEIGAISFSLFFRILTEKQITSKIREFSFNLKIEGKEIMYIPQKFSNLRFYDLGKSGRQRFNERFRLNLSYYLRYLVPTDLIFALQEIKYFKKKKIYLDDINSLKIRRLRSIGELLYIEFCRSFLLLERSNFHKSRSSFPFKDDYWKCNNLVTFELFDHIFRLFFLRSPLFQFADQINPFSDLTNKRRLTRLGQNGLNLANRKIEVRNIHPT